jgi:hypothetical protein
MNVINKKSTEVIGLSGYNQRNTYITVEDKRIFFTKAVMLMCDIQPGIFIHFLNDGSEWAFYCNDDPDGFRLTGLGSKSGLHLSSVGLVTMLRKSTGYNSKGFKKFYVEKTNAMHDRCPVFKINT